MASCGVCGVALRKFVCSKCTNESIHTKKKWSKIDENTLSKAEELRRKWEERQKLEDEQQRLLSRLQVAKKLKEGMLCENARLKKEREERQEGLRIRRERLRALKQDFEKVVKSNPKASILQEKEAISKSLEETSEQLLKYRQLICQRIVQMYCFELVDKTKIRLVHLFFPLGSFHAAPPMVLSVALGFLVHLLLLIADKLDLSFPYVMEHFGSFSTIHVSKLPLYLAEDEANAKDFKLALILLHHNIQYLAFTQRVPSDQFSPEEPLFNAYRCLRSKQFGDSKNPHSLIAPEHLEQEDFPISLEPSLEEKLFLISSEFQTDLGDDEWDLVEFEKPPPEKRKP